MQRRTAGLIAALGLLAVPHVAAIDESIGGADVPVRQHIASRACDARGVVAPGCPWGMAPVLRRRAAAPARDSAFPVRGRHHMGSEVNGFGGGRGHEGHDIFAACGTPVVAARAGKVVEAATEGNEGNYVVIEGSDRRQQAYAHLLRPSSARRGDRVGTGERIGSVGESGNAVGCHLHFELWTAPGRFIGGSAIDPRPALNRWASED